MNIVIGIAILLTLMLSDSPFSAENIDVGTRLCGLLLLTVLAPFTATVLVLHTTRTNSDEITFQQEVLKARFNSSIHTCIWIISSLAIVLAIGWHDIVRQTFHLANWIFIDEALIIAPMLVSLIVSWAIFFEQHSDSIDRDKRFAAMLQYVGLRCKVYLLMVLVPIAIVILLKDLWPMLEQLSPALAGSMAVLAIVTMLLMMPMVIRLIWTNRPITDEEGRSALLQVCQNHQLSIQEIRVWDTNHQVINALVAGLHPQFRTLMVTDLLLRSFPASELAAVLRHEAGHVNLRHLPTRIGFILLPALALFAMDMDPNQSLNVIFSQFGFAEGAALVMGLIFFAYVVLVTAWLSRNMEFEADLYAIGALNDRSAGIENPEHAQAMADALLRFAEQNPDQYSRRSITHPSLMERIELIKRSSADPKTARHFQRRFVVHQFMVAFGMLALMAGLLVI